VSAESGGALDGVQREREEMRWCGNRDFSWCDGSDERRESVGARLFRARERERVRELSSHTCHVPKKCALFLNVYFAFFFLPRSDVEPQPLCIYIYIYIYIYIFIYLFIID